MCIRNRILVISLLLIAQTIWGAPKPAELPTTVEPESSMEFHIRFNPSEAGLRTATFTVTNTNDTETPNYSFSICGGESSLPVEITSFSAHCRGNAVKTQKVVMVK